MKTQTLNITTDHSPTQTYTLAQEDDNVYLYAGESTEGDVLDSASGTTASLGAIANSFWAAAVAGAYPNTYDLHNICQMVNEA